MDLEIGPGDDPTARIHITNLILDPTDSFFYPVGGEASIDLTNETMMQGRMSYAQIPGVYTAESIPIEEGVTYDLVIDIPEKGVSPLVASTTVPYAKEIESVTLQSSIINVVGNDAFGTVEVLIELPDIDSADTYYHLIPTIKNGEQAAGGIIQYDQIAKSEIEILTDNNGIKQFIHKNGIFIDNSMIETKIVGLKLNYLVEPQFIDNVDSVSFTLRTINTESMVYHDNTDRELRISSLPLDEPQISANNIENGYGLFGAYSSDTVIVPIN